ncbi:hypothetical protein Tco_0565909 [Tanacetum coccineum]
MVTTMMTESWRLVVASRLVNVAVVASVGGGHNGVVFEDGDDEWLWYPGLPVRWDKTVVVVMIEVLVNRSVYDLRAHTIVIADARSQQAASMTKVHLLGHTFPMSYAKTQISILKGTAARVDFADQITYYEKVIDFEKDKDVAVLQTGAPKEKLRPKLVGVYDDIEHYMVFNKSIGEEESNSKLHGYNDFNGGAPASQNGAASSYKRTATFQNGVGFDNGNLH